MSSQSGWKISTPSMTFASAVAFSSVALTSSRAEKPPPMELTSCCCSVASMKSRSFLPFALCGAFFTRPPA